MNTDNLQPAWKNFMTVLNKGGHCAYLNPKNNSGAIRVAPVSQYFQLAFNKLQKAPNTDPAAITTFFKEVYAMTAMLKKNASAEIQSAMDSAYQAFVDETSKLGLTPFTPQNHEQTHWLPHDDDLPLILLMGPKNNSAITTLIKSAIATNRTIIMHNAPEVMKNAISSQTTLSRSGDPKLSSVNGFAEQFGTAMTSASSGIMTNATSGMSGAPEVPTPTLKNPISVPRNEVKSLTHGCFCSAGRSSCGEFLDCIGSFCQGCCECIAGCCQLLSGCNC